MFNFNNVKIFVCKDPINMRNGFDGKSGVVKIIFKMNF
jgi:hypothetical protein